MATDKNKITFKTSISYFDDKNILKDILIFCKNNISLLVFTALTILITYSIYMFHPTIGIDTEAFSFSKSHYTNYHISIGRWGLAFFSELWTIKFFNPYLISILSAVILFFAAISWSYLFSVFNKNRKINKYFLIPFSILFISSPFWIEQYYFFLQSVEVFFAVFLCPFIILMLYKSIFSQNYLFLLVSVLLTTFIIAIYQTMLPLFVCGIFICFLFFEENSNYTSKLYLFTFIKLLIFILLATLTYFLLNKLTLSLFHIKASDYISSMNTWSSDSLTENFNKILNITYCITIEPVLKFIHHDYVEINYVTPLIIPLCLTYILIIIINTFKHISKERRLLYIIVGISIPFFIISLPVLNANMPPLRAMYVVVLVTAFMFYYLLLTSKKKVVQYFIFSTMLLVSIWQIQINSQLQYSDTIRYNEDIRICYEIDKLVKQNTNLKEKEIHLAVFGRYTTVEHYKHIYMKGEVIGNSCFEYCNWGDDITKPSRGSIAFMRTIGINYTLPTSEEFTKAQKYLSTMGVFPSADCIKVIDNLAIIKLSE
ncbi:MAG: glucosyltransferase domain-containing protein [Bacteroidales bacterium]|jgi:hypothetical protein|nr:glucosyltransferase domain-containing protein [Bacteroidales bacterium]